MVKKLNTINNNCIAKYPAEDLYVCTFNKAEMAHINEALRRYDLVKEIRTLIKEQEHEQS